MSPLFLEGRKTLGRGKLKKLKKLATSKVAMAGLGFAAGGMVGTKVTQMLAAKKGGKVQEGGFFEQIKGLAKNKMQKRRSDKRISEEAIKNSEAGPDANTNMNATTPYPVDTQVKEEGIIDKILRALGL